MVLTLHFSSPSAATAPRFRCTLPLAKLPPVVYTSPLLSRKNRNNAISAPVTARREGYSRVVVRSQEEKHEDSQTQGEPVATGDEKTATELGAQVKAAMEERKKMTNEDDLVSGVAEEVRQIEWPVFRKVLGTTGVVLGVIAGSSVVLLTVNFVLAELSDRLFDGKGVQDFF